MSKLRVLVIPVLIAMIVTGTSVQNEINPSRSLLNSTRGMVCRIAVFVDGIAHNLQKDNSLKSLLEAVNQDISKDINIHLQVIHISNHSMPSIPQEALPTVDVLIYEAGTLVRSTRRSGLDYDHLILLHASNISTILWPVLKERKKCQHESVNIIPLKVFRNASKEWVYVTDKEYLLKMVILGTVDSITQDLYLEKPNALKCLCYGSRQIPCLESLQKLDNDDLSVYPFHKLDWFIQDAKKAIASMIKEKGIRNILGLLNEVYSNTTVMSICGNGITELGEQCDCFFRDQDCRHACDIKTCNFNQLTRTTRIIIAAVVVVLIVMVIGVSCFFSIRSIRGMTANALQEERKRVFQEQ